MYTVCLNLCIHQAASYNNLTITCSCGVPVECKPKINTGYICESFISVGRYLQGKMQIALLTELKGRRERAPALSGNSSHWLQLFQLSLNYNFIVFTVPYGIWKCFNMKIYWPTVLVDRHIKSCAKYCGGGSSGGCHCF